MNPLATAALSCTRRHTIDRNERLNMTIVIYLIAAAVIICGCLLFITKLRSRD